jgi:hypothetical protein
MSRDAQEIAREPDRPGQVPVRADSRFDAADAIAFFVCPTCDALEGERCHGRNGRLRRGAHQTRIARAVAQRLAASTWLRRRGLRG